MIRALAPVLAIGVMLAGCTSTQASFTPAAKGQSFAPRARDYPIEILEGDQAPTRPYDEVGELNVHLESTGFVGFTFADALPQLQAKARAAGADAIMAISEKRTRYLETSMYNLSAKAIRYRN